MKETHKVLLLGEQGRVLDSLYENLKKYYNVIKSEIGTAENEKIIVEDNPDLIIIYFTEFVKWKLFPIKKTSDILVENNISVVAAAEEKDIETIKNYLSGVNIIGVAQPAATKTIYEAMSKILVSQKSSSVKSGSEIVKKNILVIEDDPETIKIITSTLGIHYELNFARTVGQGFIRFALKKADLIILNYSMPDCAGKQAMNMFRATEETKNIPVICMESAKNIDLVKECIELNPAGCLLKPFETKYLFDEVKRVI